MNIKQLAAAAALVCAGPSFAGVNPLNEDGELFAVVWDEAFATYVLELNATIGELKAATSSFALGTVGGANWASYIEADTNRNDFQPFEGTRWAIFAVDEDGFNFIDGDLQWISTSTGDLTPMPTNIVLDTLVGGTGTGGMSGVFNQNGLTPDYAVDTSLFAALGTPGHFIEGTYTGSAGFFAGNAIGGTQKLFYCTHKDGFNADGPANCGSFKNSAGFDVGVSFDGQNFGAVVAIPEPGTYAMLLAGLSAVGFMVRRRAGH